MFAIGKSRNEPVYWWPASQQEVWD